MCSTVLVLALVHFTQEASGIFLTHTFFFIIIPEESNTVYGLRSILLFPYMCIEYLAL
jgi:hypothetical protein